MPSANDVALPLARLALDLAAVGTIGALVAGGILTPTSGSTGLSPVGRRCARAAGFWAYGWGAAALGGGVLTALASNGPVLSPVRAQLATAVLAGLLALGATRAGTVPRLRGLLVLALIALLPVLLADRGGHTTGDGASAFLVVHVVAVTLWLGGLAGLVLHLRGRGSELPLAASRFSRLALGCFCVVALSGPAVAFGHLGTSREQWSDGYGRLVLTKVVLLLALGAIGVAHRRRTLPRLAAGRPRSLLRLAAGELVVMVTAVGVGVGLVRTAAGANEDGHAAGDRSAGVAGPVTWRDLVVDVAPVRLSTALLLALLLATLLGYLHAVRRVSAAGRTWPVARTAAAAGAGVLALLVVGGGLTAHAPSFVSIHVTRHLLLALVVPALVALSAPLTLLQLSRGRDLRWPSGAAGRVVSDPVNAGTALLLGTVLLYATPVLGLTLRDSLLQTLLDVTVLLTGSAFWTAVLAVDAVPHRRSASDRAAALAALVVCLAVFGAVLLTRDVVSASASFPQGVDRVHDQQHAAAVVLGLAALGAFLPLWVTRHVRKQPVAASAVGRAVGR